MDFCKLAFVAFLATSALAKETKLLITSGAQTQVVDFENPDLTCTLKPDYLPDANAINDDWTTPYPVSDHCTVIVNDQALLTGGHISKPDKPRSLPKLSKVAKFFTEDRWQSAPSMKVKRVNHGCGHFTHR